MMILANGFVSGNQFWIACVVLKQNPVAVQNK